MQRKHFGSAGIVAWWCAWSWRAPHGASTVTAPRYSIGIDLGTTNTAVAYAALDRDGASELLAIPQVDSPSAVVSARTLPSFLYLPEAIGRPDGDDDDADARWIAGRYARKKAGDTPGRVVHSAKSWLIHHSADRSARFLPWGSDDVVTGEKLSPIGASALILRHVREAWNDAFAPDGSGPAFETQAVTVTVPASFDAVAQRLTLDAAREAGFPETVRLLEEPQAALYRWLELHERTTGGPAVTLGLDAEARHVLVVDVGGGTSDFSLFAFHRDAAATEPRIERIAVSDHILLGGDNMDLALAHRLEPQLTTSGDNLSGRQWDDLVAQARDMKETALSGDGAHDDAFTVSIAGRGSRLIVQAMSAQLTRAEIERLLLDGFFPECAADEYPIRARTALRELGLPYARDPGVTRHLADFLRGRPRVDAVLFNGGALHPPRLRRRIAAQIGAWQSGAEPIILEASELDLAVARGAARFGSLVHAHAHRIEAGVAQAIFLGAHRATGGTSDPALVCVVPHGAPTEYTFVIDTLNLDLRVNRPVRFETYTSTRRETDRAGAVVTWNERDFARLPPLETEIAAPGAADTTLPVRLTAAIRELGRLEIRCVSASADIPGTWPLAFDLRGAASPPPGQAAAAVTGAPHENGLNVSSAALDAARARITALFSRPVDRRDRLTASRLLKSLEHLLQAPKSSWNVVLVRTLWATLEACMTYRRLSADHAEAWLILAGFFLRPGFGAALDDVRIDRLWTLHDDDLTFAAKSVELQEYVLWRRVAGGLSAQRQTAVLAPERARLIQRANPPPELVLLAGALERLDADEKTALVERFLDAAAGGAREGTHNAHFLAALGSLLARAPLYAGPEYVLAPALVQRAFETLSRFDWDGPRHLEMQQLFLRAARVVDNRNIDLSRSLRTRIADKLEKSGVAEARTAALKAYVPIARAERAGNFGESLPPGLILRESVPA